MLRAWPRATEPKSTRAMTSSFKESSLMIGMICCISGIVSVIAEPCIIFTISLVLSVSLHISFCGSGDWSAEITPGILSFLLLTLSRTRDHIYCNRNASLKKPPIKRNHCSGIPAMRLSGCQRENLIRRGTGGSQIGEEIAFVL